MRKTGLAAVVIGLAALSALAPDARQSVALPYDRTNPIMYDNDWTNDYIDWYLMALASAGDIQYRGISTSSSIPPYNRYMTAAQLDQEVSRRTGIVRAGRNSGFRNVPDPIEGTRGHLVRPAFGRIEDTHPLDSPGSRAVLFEARNATAAKPLVVLLGGPATAVASAYLLDNTIADKVIVAFVANHVDGLYGFNGWSDGWAANIVVQRMRLVVFPIAGRQYPRLAKQWIHDNLPLSEARDYMLAAKLDVENGDDGDGDGMPAVAIMRPDYVRATKRASFGGWRRRDGHEMPIFFDDPNGRVIVVTEASGPIGTQEYQRALSNPAAWNPPLAAAVRPRGAILFRRPLDADRNGGA